MRTTCDFRVSKVSKAKQNKKVIWNFCGVYHVPCHGILYFFFFQILSKDKTEHTVCIHTHTLKDTADKDRKADIY